MCGTYIFYSTLCGDDVCDPSRHIIKTFPEKCDAVKSGNACRGKTKKVISEKCCCDYDKCCNRLGNEALRQRVKAEYNAESFESYLKGGEELDAHEASGLHFPGASKRSSTDEKKLANLVEVLKHWENAVEDHSKCAKKRQALSPEDFIDYPQLQWYPTDFDDPELHENQGKESAEMKARPRTIKSEMDLDPKPKSRSPSIKPEMDLD